LRHRHLPIILLPHLCQAEGGVATGRETFGRLARRGFPPERGWPGKERPAPPGGPFPRATPEKACAGYSAVRSALSSSHKWESAANYCGHARSDGLGVSTEHIEMTIPEHPVPGASYPIPRACQGQGGGRFQSAVPPAVRAPYRGKACLCRLPLVVLRFCPVGPDALLSILRQFLFLLCH
jgi:hypothetical protein